MVALPRHVHRVPSGGREYFYFQAFRNTPQAGPRIRLPNDPSSTEFWTEYNRLSDTPAQAPGSFDALIAAYKDSPEFATLAAETKRHYLRHMETIAKRWGPHPVADLRAKNVTKLRNAFADKPATANGLVRMVSTLIKWSIPLDWRDTNPCTEVKRLKTGEYDPWPGWAIDLARQGPRHLVGPMETALYTGQRQGDCLRMLWSDIEDNGIWVRQSKTGKRLWIPFHTDYRAILDGLERASPHIHVNSFGRPWAQTGFRKSWGTFIADIPEIKDEGLVFHGLRKTACCNLAEAGCTSSQIQAITGHSLAMVEHYSRGADQKRRAKAAIVKLEKRR